MHQLGSGPKPCRLSLGVRKCSLFERDEGSLGELLLAAARQGSHIITIYVPQREHIDDVSTILFNHGARLIKYVAGVFIL